MRSPTRSISFGISWSRGITPLDAAGFDDHVAALDPLRRAGQQIVLALEESR
jgi:hypothetical protein